MKTHQTLVRKKNSYRNTKRCELVERWVRGEHRNAGHSFVLPAAPALQDEALEHEQLRAVRLELQPAVDLMPQVQARVSAGLLSASNYWQVTTTGGLSRRK